LGGYGTAGAGLLGPIERHQGLDSHFLNRVGHCLADLIDLLVGVKGGDGRADEVLSGGHSGCDRHDGENAFLAQGLPKRVGALLRAEDDGDGGRLATPSIEAERVEHIAVAAGVGPEAFAVLGLVLQDVECGAGDGGLGGAERSTEDGLLRVSAQVFDDFARGGDEAAGAAKRFREAAAEDVDLGTESEMSGGAASPLAEHAEAVCVVEDGEAAVRLAECREFGQAADVAFHRINALEDEHLRGIGRGGFECLAEIGRVVVGEAFDRCH